MALFAWFLPLPPPLPPDESALQETLELLDREIAVRLAMLRTAVAVLERHAHEHE